MYKSILSGAFHGMESFLVQVEADISDGLPCMDMIGYLSSEVKETRERVRVGIKNSGYQLPVKRITINLSPADMRCFFSTCTSKPSPPSSTVSRPT